MKEYKQVFVVNKDLKMGKGKIAVQVAHGEVHFMLHEPSISTIEWFSNFMKKIVLKATKREILDISRKLSQENIWFSLVQDKGYTQVPPDSMTCLVTEPLTEEQSKMFKHLKLL